jgi:hypothetical protein
MPMSISGPCNTGRIGGLEEQMTLQVAVFEAWRGRMRGTSDIHRKPARDVIANLNRELEMCLEQPATIVTW